VRLAEPRLKRTSERLVDENRVEAHDRVDTMMFRPSGHEIG
jgi:hypothetical protein